MRIFLVVIAFLTFGASAHAQDDVEAFTEAWNLYQSLVDEGRFDEAVQPANQLIFLARRIEPSNTVALGRLYYNLGFVQIRVGARTKAEAALLEALGHLEKGSDQPSIELGDTHLALGDLVAAADPERSERHFRDGLAVYETIYGETDPRTAAPRRRLGAHMLVQNRLSGAKRHLNRAAELTKEAGPAFDLEHAYALFELGKLELARRRENRAIEHLTSALAALQEKAPKDPMVSRVHTLLVAAFVRENDDASATRHLKALAPLVPVEDTNRPEPVFRIAPDWPRKAQVQGIAGYVDYRFTVDVEGRVKDIEVAKSRPDLFARYGRDALLQFRYVPRIVNGVFVEAPA